MNTSTTQPLLDSKQETAADARGRAALLTVVVLTFNEQIHIRRCIESVSTIASRIIVVDSGSTDNTVEIAREMGADVHHHAFENHSRQLNWALANTSIDAGWVLRLDADEYLTPELARALPTELAGAAEDVSGFTLNLRRVFMDKWLRHGALYPIRLLRIWRFGAGRCEERWMDEHMTVNGRVSHIDFDFADHNLNSLTWWTEKHNKYASREAVELLNLEYQFLPGSSESDMSRSHHARAKGFVKEHIYARLPAGTRALAYFLYRYVFRFGFLDGAAGTVFHVLQGFWYRYLVDAKIAEVKLHMRKTGNSIEASILAVLGIRL